MRGAVFELVRVTIECKTPMRIGAGGSDDLHDAVFAVDANGLPTLPGTSIAGVLRHALGASQGEQAEARAFGFQERSDGQASQVEVSFGQVHDQDDRPVPFRGADLQDPVLAFVAAGIPRDHVRISSRGAADGRGKHDELVVPAGARFTFELLVHSGAGVSASALLNLLSAPWMRLGGRSRGGLGRFEVVAAVGRGFDLRKPDDRGAFVRLPRALHAPLPGGLLAPVPHQEPPTPPGKITGVLTLRPRDYWVVGRGDPHRAEHMRHGDAYVDTVPVEERRVVWVSGRGRVQTRNEAPPVVPGSSLKGTLRHRTEYHARRRARRWELPEAPGQEGASPLVEALFGSIKEGESGQPGRVIVSDGAVEGASSGRLDHVSLDRFTQGPLDHHLFSEAPLYQGLVRFDLAVDTDEIGLETRQAFADAVDDLLQGRLAIGGGASRGHGYCAGEIHWSDQGRWLGAR